jgi:hypothetical protein
MKSRLLESYRSDAEPGSFGSFRRAAQAAGVEARTARRAWERGWPGIRPISEQIEAEKLTARAALRREVLAQRADEASRLAAEDYSEERQLEGKSARLIANAARGSLMAMHAERVQDYQRTLARMIQDADDPDSPKARGARKALKDIAEVVRTAAETLACAQRLGALILGTPTVVLGGSVEVKPVVPTNVTADELAAEVAAAERAVTELRALETAAGGNGVAVPVHQPC